MCDVLVPALIGVAALGLLGGGTAVGAGCNYCPTGPVCAVTQVGNKTITIPQLAGEGTNVVQVPVQDNFAYAQQAGPAHYGAPAPYAPPPQGAYAQPGAPVGHYGALPPAPSYYDPNAANVGANFNYDGQSALGAGAYSNDAGFGIGANVGDANIGLGAQSY